MVQHLMLEGRPPANVSGDDIKATHQFSFPFMNLALAVLTENSDLPSSTANCLAVLDLSFIALTSSPVHFLNARVAVRLVATFRRFFCSCVQDLHVDQIPEVFLGNSPPPLRSPHDQHVIANTIRGPGNAGSNLALSPGNS